MQAVSFGIDRDSVLGRETAEELSKLRERRDELVILLTHQLKLQVTAEVVVLFTSARSGAIRRWFSSLPNSRLTSPLPRSVAKPPWFCATTAPDPIHPGGTTTL